MGGSAAGAMEHSAAMHAAASPAPPPPAAPSAVPSAAKEESTSAAKEADPSGADGVPSQQMTRRDRIRRALKEEAGIADGRLPGAYKDEGDDQIERALLEAAGPAVWLQSALFH